MAIKKSVAKSGLDGFRSWLQEHFPGQRLSVSHSKEGDDYLCSLKFRGVILGQATAATQKLSAEKAAADAHKLCSGDPLKLRGILRGSPSVELTSDAEVAELPPPAPPKSEVSEDKKTRKLIVDMVKQLEQAQSLIQSQAKDLKRLKREVADLQNLNLNTRIEATNSEIGLLKRALKASESKEPPPGLEATLAAWERRLQTLESNSGFGVRKETEPAPPEGAERTYRDFKEALVEWAPDYAEMALPIVAAILAFRLIALPGLSILRAFQQVLGDEAHLAVVSAEPGWVANSQAMCPAVLREFQKATAHPHRLHLVVFDGLNRVGLNTWARGICNWAASLTCPPELHQQSWPANLRVCFVPAQTRLVGLLTQKIAAITPVPEKECGFFSRIGTRYFVGPGLAKVRCQRERLRASLKLLGHAHLADQWEDKLLRLWPAMYQSEAWWTPLEMDGSK